MPTKKPHSMVGMIGEAVSDVVDDRRKKLRRSGVIFTSIIGIISSFWRIDKRRENTRTAF